MQISNSLNPTLAMLAFTLACSAGAAEPAGNRLLASETLSYDSNLDSMQLHAKGTDLFDASGKPVWLYEDNSTSLEWSNDGEHMRKSVNRAIADWKVNLIRLLLAQDRWLGKMKDKTNGGATYRISVDRLGF